MVVVAAAVAAVVMVEVEVEGVVVVVMVVVMAAAGRVTSHGARFASSSRRSFSFSSHSFCRAAFRSAHSLFFWSRITFWYANHSLRWSLNCGEAMEV